MFQCFHKTLGTRRRQWPPSKQEILCTINRRPIYARFHFMDGQFHAIEFDPSATATEVLKLVKAKIGLRDNAQGKLKEGLNVIPYDSGPKDNRFLNH